MIPLNITIKPLAVGTASVTIQFAKKKVNLEYTLICDPLADWAKAVIRIENGKSNFEEVLFSNEPGDVKLTLTKIDRQHLRISVYQNKDTIYGGVPVAKPNIANKHESFKLVPVNIAHFKHLLSFDIPVKQLRQALTEAIEAFQVSLNHMGISSPQSSLFTRALKVNYKKLKV